MLGGSQRRLSPPVDRLLFSSANLHLVVPIYGVMVAEGCCILNRRGRDFNCSSRLPNTGGIKIGKSCPQLQYRVFLDRLGSIDLKFVITNQQTLTCAA